MGALKPRSSLLFSLTTDPAHCEPARRHYTGSKLRRLVGVARGPIGSNRSNRVETSAAYMTKIMNF